MRERFFFSYYLIICLYWVGLGGGGAVHLVDEGEIFHMYHNFYKNDLRFELNSLIFILLFELFALL